MTKAAGHALPVEERFGGEAELVAALREGDAAAYTQLVRQLGGRAYAVALRFLRNEADAEDCVQEAFLHAFRSLESFEGRSSLATWFHRIVVNDSLMRLRSSRRRPEHSIEQLLPQFDSVNTRVEPTWRFEESVDSMVERRETRMLVRHSIDRLPESYRTVLLLRDIEGVSTREAATLLGKSPAAVKIMLHRARAALKKLLEPMFEAQE
jgi:RNA polymerase sigma-70 factor (ECF subfamily)